MKRIPFKEFKKIYSRVPRLCVEVILKDSRGILLTRRTIEPANGKWHTPGGTVIKGENLRHAVKRVAKEELGLKIDVMNMLGVIEYGSFRNHYSQDISIAFLVKSISKRPPMLDGHADKYGFFADVPANTIKEQKEFLVRELGMKTG